jgi:hypothetical protein
MQVDQLGQHAAVRFWKVEPDGLRIDDLQVRP